MRKSKRSIVMRNIKRIVNLLYYNQNHWNDVEIVHCLCTIATTTCDDIFMTRGFKLINDVYGEYERLLGEDIERLNREIESEEGQREH